MERAAKLLARCAAFLAVYAAAFVLWTPLGLQVPLWLEPLAAGSQVMARLVESPPLTADVAVHQRWFYVTSVPVSIGVVRQEPIRTSTFTNVIPILLALVVVAPALSLLQRLKMAVLCIAVLYAITVLALTCLVESGYARLQGFAGTSLLASQPPFMPMYTAVEHALGSYIAILAMLFAIVGVGFIALVRPVPIPSDRNAPCPCGSGRKLKLCCGRART